MSRKPFQPGLFDGVEGLVYENLMYIDSIGRDHLVVGSADGVANYIAFHRRNGFEGDFNIWDYPALVTSYKDMDEALLRLKIPSGLEARLAFDVDQ